MEPFSLVVQDTKSTFSGLRCDKTVQTTAKHCGLLSEQFICTPLSEVLLCFSEIKMSMVR